MVFDHTPYSAVLIPVIFDKAEIFLFGSKKVPEGKIQFLAKKKYVKITQINP